MVVNRIWIVNGAAMTAPLTLPKLPTVSDGESEVGASDKDLPSPWQLISKVQQSDDVEHILDKGVWVATGAK